MPATHARRWAAALLFLLVSAAATDLQAFPHCWGVPDTAYTSDEQLSSLQARIDSDGRVHLFWFNHAESGICYMHRNTAGSWAYEGAITYYSDNKNFAITLDSSDNLHLVWSDTTGSLGASGQTSHLYYKWKPEGGVWQDSVCVTPTLNNPDSLQIIPIEDFEDGVPPSNWGFETDNTGLCWSGGVEGVGDTLWGKWQDGGAECALGGSHCASASRFYGCGGNCSLHSCECYLVLPPVIFSSGDSITFYCRVAADGDTVGLRLLLLDKFTSWNHTAFAGESQTVELWHGPALTDTAYQKVAVALPSELAGRIAFLAFEMYSSSDTAAAVCVDSVLAGVSESARPETALSAAVCSRPSMIVDGSGDIHVVFERFVWQPEACFCGSQMYYVRRDAVSGTWGPAWHIDGSGVGDRDYGQMHLWRGVGESDIAADGSGNVHLVWRDVGAMNIVPHGDDILYSYHSATSHDSEWQNIPDTLSNDGFEPVTGRDWGANDTSYCLAPDLLLDASNNPTAVFHGQRPEWSRPPPGQEMIVWWRKKSSGGSWSDTCMAVPDPAVDHEVINARWPSVDLDSDGNMFVAYTWQNVIGGEFPHGSAFAQYIADDEQWVYPARVISGLADNTQSVIRPMCFQLDSAGAAHFAWIQDRRTTPNWSTSYEWNVLYMKSLDWHTCVDESSLSMTVADKYIRGLSPNEYAQGKDPESKRSFRLAFSVHDTSGCPMPEFPSGMFTVAVSETCLNPTDVCYGFDEELECATPGWDPLVKFWCQERQDTLFITESTNAQGQALFRENNVSGTARLTLTPVFGSVGVGEEQIVWVTNCDHCDTLGKVDNGSDFSAFATAYVRWATQGLENWTWDLVHVPAYDSCDVDSVKRPIFKVCGPDFSFFAAHNGSSFVESAACDGE